MCIRDSNIIPVYGKKFFVSITHMSRTRKMLNVVGFVLIQVCLPSGIESVSYTHLDVYKRQQIITGNLNATTIMIGEKMADAIRGRQPLPRSAVIMR